MSRAKQLVQIVSVLAIALMSWGCSSTSNESAPKFEKVTGQHPGNWKSVHYAEFIKNPDQCRTCHGSTSDKAAAGGVSQVSCFSCHPSGVSHQAGFEAGLQHGRAGAQLAPTATAGFAYCAKCHGADYTNPIGTASSCKQCHTKAPHPNKPWTGPTLSTSNHTLTAQGNAPECAKCHTNGANSDMKPSTPAPAGTAPGCFNNTLCHGTSIH